MIGYKKIIRILPAILFMTLFYDNVARGATRRPSRSGVTMRSGREGERKKALEAAQKKQTLEEGVDKRSMAEIQQANTPNRYVQTQAHLRLKYVRDTLLDQYGDKKVIPYMDIISQAIVKEAQLKNTHYAFYHSTSGTWSVPVDLFTLLYSYFNPDKKVPEDFRFLRFKGESTGQSVQEFLSDEFKKSGLIDDSGELRDILLSVNLAVFGNMGSETECTWKYFLKDEREGSNPEVYKEVMDIFGLTHDYVDELVALEDLIRTEEASLLQIMVPQDIIDEIVYLAWIRGVPAMTEMMDWVKNYQKTSENVPKRDRGSLAYTKVSREALAEKFKKEREKNPIFRKFMEDLEAGDFSAEAFLKAYCNKPLELENINETAARILFTPDGLLNPNSGIKFYRYLVTSKDKLKEYNLKLNLLVQKLVDEKEKREEAAAE